MMGTHPSCDSGSELLIQGFFQLSTTQHDSFCDGVLRVAIKSDVGSFGYITSCGGGDDMPGSSPGATPIAAGDGNFFTGFGIPGDSGGYTLGCV